MEITDTCKETIGLFVIRTCDANAVAVCEKCSKPVCAIHIFNSLKLQPEHDKLCLTCFTEEDTRLTKDIEVYSKDRYVWRRKMIDRFHQEYHYMVFMAEDYGDLFMTGDHYFYDDDMDDGGSFFDS